RAVAMATAQRYPALPDVPTFAESGMPQYRYNAWFGLLAPAKTPAAILKKVSEDVASVMKDADVIKRLEAMSAIPLVSTPEQFDETVRSDAERYGKLLKAAGVSGR
ncbi:MAG: tripartite tricarboxylate transporter substrate binding protein, partial [Rhizobiales bacterium]|nr:tripartite tricarboxylate transporter substrate binding protein [Hyphomicrobiales bacterium]